MTKKIVIGIIISLMLTGCSNAAIRSETPGVVVATETHEPVTESEPTTELSNEPATESMEKNPKEAIDLSLNPNEAGKIMVLMYHNIGDEEKEWVRTPENFKKDLLTLYENGYRPISLRDYVSGNITTPQGYTPVVITFDDGKKNNFEYLEDGSLDKNSAVGILIDFNKQYPDFSPAATFFIYGNNIFGQKGLEEDKIKFLLENGMDIGNHSRTHANFTQISKEDLQMEIGAQAQFLESFLKDAAYSIDTMALPFGTRPKEDSIKDFLKEGIYNGIAYKNVAILNVGWNPGYSPYDTRFDFGNIPRIRASEMKVETFGLYNYIEHFKNKPEDRFISDGFPDIITVPEAKAELITTESTKEIYIYKESK